MRLLHGLSDLLAEVPEEGKGASWGGKRFKFRLKACGFGGAPYYSPYMSLYSYSLYSPYMSLYSYTISYTPKPQSIVELYISLMFRSYFGLRRTHGPQYGPYVSDPSNQATFTI